MATRGKLRIYLGSAPGVGKTYAMLDEGHRRKARGTDVVVGFCETHGRIHTASQLEGLEAIPRTSVLYRDTEFTEMDLDAILARGPQVVLVDELAHTNVPGSKHEKRWQDVEELLEAGFDVITTVNVQHLESLNDVVTAITGVVQRETVPDAVVRAAEQVELVDMTPEALRRRMAHGNIYAHDKVDAALSNYFRVGNLTALRELALLWLADSVEEGLRKYRQDHGIADPWETRERVVVALTGGPEGATLIRRAARIAARSTGGELLAVHIARSDGLAGADLVALEEQRLLIESLGGSYRSVVGDDVATALLDFARAHDATQVVLGASRRGWLKTALTGPGVGASVTRQSGPIDVHLVSHELAAKGRSLPRLTRGLTVQRRLLGAGLALVLLAGLTAVLTASRHQLGLGSDLLLYLVAVVLVALVGGFYPALFAAVAGSLLINFYFVPPLHTFTIATPEDVLALVVFVIVAALVSSVVDLAARRTSSAARASAETNILMTLAGSLLRGEHALPALLRRVQETFGATSVSLLRRVTDAPTSARGSGKGGLRGTWSCVESLGDDPPVCPGDGDVEAQVGDDMLLVIRGRPLPAEDQRLLSAFATQVGVAYQQGELAEAAEAAVPLAAADRMRTALLNAVSHDLRTPLAAAKANITSLRSADMTWDKESEAVLLAEADHALDRLTALVTDLLDISRLEAGFLPVLSRPVALDEVVPLWIGRDQAERIVTDIPETLPEVVTDPGLLERVLANLVENAIRHSPPEEKVRVSASAHGDWVELRVSDHGPGVPDSQREAIFLPFQRLEDHVTSESQGVGLGLAVARGFTEAMRGTLTVEDTPGGGLTMVVSLPIRPL